MINTLRLLERIDDAILRLKDQNYRIARIELSEELVESIRQSGFFVYEQGLSHNLFYGYPLKIVQGKGANWYAIIGEERELT